jgi:uncharacterized protein YdcH (DUF465 family)
MQITLRRANAVQASIQEALKSIVLVDSIAIDEFQDVVSTIDKASQQLMDSFKRQTDLLHALYSIRGGIGQANAKSGINDKLTAISFTSKRLEYLSALTSAVAKSDFKLIEAKLNKISNAKESFYDKTVSTGVLSQSEIDDFKRVIQNLKKQKVVLADEVLALNVSTVITLDDTTVTVLTKENLL